MRKALCTFAASLLLSGMSFACTTIIVSREASATGRPLMWKQRDSSVEYNYMDHFQGNGLAFTGLVNSRDTLRNSVWCGSNEAGFSIMNSVSYGLSPLRREDRPYEGMVMKKALETCRTVDDFEKYVSSIPQPNGLETNFGVIDAEGGAAYFEVHDYGYTRFDVPAGGYLIRSNYSVTGRDGEGKGYDRYDLVASKMSEHGAPFDAEWILSELARDPLISRKTSIASVVMEGIGKDASPDSGILWCVCGYPRCCYAIPVWVAAKDEIPVILRNASGQGCITNELASAVKKAVRGRVGEHIFQTAVQNAEDIEFKQGRTMDHKLSSTDNVPAMVRRYNSELFDRFEAFCFSVGRPRP